MQEGQDSLRVESGNPREEMEGMEQEVSGLAYARKEVTFPAPTSDWGKVTHFVVFPGKGVPYHRPKNRKQRKANRMFLRKYYHVHPLSTPFDLSIGEDFRTTCCLHAPPHSSLVQSRDLSAKTSIEPVLSSG